MSNRNSVILASDHKETDRVPMELWTVDKV